MKDVINGYSFWEQWRSQSSGDGGDISHGRPPWSSGPSPKMNTSRFPPPLFLRVPLGPKLVPLQPRMGHHGA